MRTSKLIRFFVAAAIVAGSLFLYPTALQAMCDTYGHDFIYYAPPDANGNVPIDPIGEEWLDCDGYYGQWGVLSGTVESHYTWCGDCERP
jgi:hypothetical protein